ncbi:MAG: metal-dependent hydrolase [Dehalococcoidia bacterium]|nr:metal-dependent hydrolase [Dehalococcoidia bacterium]
MPLVVRYLNFASFQLVTERGTNVLIDPWLAGSESEGVPPSPLTLADLSPVDLVLVSHAGFDHLGDSIEIVKKTGAMLYCGGDVRELAREQGVPAGQIMGMVWGISLRHKDVSVKAVHSQHISFVNTAKGYFTGMPLGFVVTTDDGQSVYYPGDTALYSGLQLIGQLYKPDIALLHVGGFFRNGQRMSEMSPLEAAIAARFLDVKIAVPMHYMPDDVEVVEQFGRHLRKESPQTELKVLKPGDSFTFSRVGT